MGREVADIRQSPETADEESFVQRYGNQLHGMYRSLRAYRKSRDITLAHSVYKQSYNVGHNLPVYNRVFAMANACAQLYFELDAEVKQWSHPSSSKIDLGNCAPRLLTIRDCILVVPGASSLGTLASHELERGTDRRG